MGLVRVGGLVRAGEVAPVVTPPVANVINIICHNPSLPVAVAQLEAVLVRGHGAVVVVCEAGALAQPPAGARHRVGEGARARQPRRQQLQQDNCPGDRTHPLSLRS